MSNINLKGILKNKKKNKTNKISRFSSIDQNLVIKNTQINAKKTTILINNVEEGLKDVKNDRENRTSKLKWDEINLSLNENEKSCEMKITEPKTPYITGICIGEESCEDDLKDEISDMELQEKKEEKEEKAEKAEKAEKEEKEEYSEQKKTEIEQEETFKQMRKKHYDYKQRLMMQQESVEKGNEKKID